jgi:hypothetical protein
VQAPVKNLSFKSPSAKSFRGILRHGSNKSLTTVPGGGAVVAPIDNAAGNDGHTKPVSIDIAPEKQLKQRRASNADKLKEDIDGSRINTAKGKRFGGQNTNTTTRVTLLACVRLRVWPAPKPSLHPVVLYIPGTGLRYAWVFHQHRLSSFAAIIMDNVTVR